VTSNENCNSIELMDAIQAGFDYPKWENPMGERRKDALRVNFDRKLKLELSRRTYILLEIRPNGVVEQVYMRNPSLFKI